MLPALVVAALALIGWRAMWTGTGLALLAAIPLVFVLLKGHGARDHALKARRDAETATGAGGGDRSLSGALRDPGLWLRLPALLAPSFIFTGLIFHQVHMAAAKGWPLSLIAGSFTIFAAASVIATIFAGPLVDRVSARRIVPVFLGPLTLACLVLAASDSALAAPVFMGLLGLGTGLTAVMWGTLWAELYGVTHLGAIRAFGQSAMVFSSGLAPAVMGLLIDRGVSIETIAAASAVYCVAASALAAITLRPRRAVA